MAFDDRLIALVLEQIEQDLHDGNYEPLADMLDTVPRHLIVGYLSYRLKGQAFNSGLITQAEFENE